MSDLSVFTKPAFSPTKVDNLTFMHDQIIVSDMKFEDRITKGGIILVNDDKKSAGIRPRWAKVYGLGPDYKDDTIQIGKWILISHGRWTRGITVETPSGELTLRKVDPNDILLVSDTPMEDETMSTQVY